jgi:rhomboid protease GluP
VRRRSYRDLPATYAILLILAIMYVLEGGLGGSPQLMRMVDLGAQVNVLVLQGQWWRIFTAIFLHLNWLHILVNGYSLFVMGELVEPAFGSRRFVVVFLLGGIMGGLLALVTYPPYTVLVGASGAIFGLLGATGVIALEAQGPMRGYLLRWLGSILVLNLAFDFMYPGIGVWDHVGGLVGGFLAATMIGGVRRLQGLRAKVAGIAYVLICAGLAGYASLHG